jgi:wobble nucleotide-excising tRNase
MVESVALLRNIGQFDSVDSGQKISFCKLTLIYAENGRGKTTLANIFRSLGTNNPVLINERRRLGASNLPHVVIKADGQSYTFQNGAWSNALSDISIFDDHFVSENVCSGLEIGTDHKQNLHELILGSQGIDLNNQLKVVALM